MHTSDATAPAPYQSSVPSMRPQALTSVRAGETLIAQDSAGGASATPIYDALYAEYRRLFRTLPGDRTGEEDLGFTSFGTGPYASLHEVRHGCFHEVLHSPTCCATVCTADQRLDRRLDQRHGHEATTVWHTSGRHHGSGGHALAALPPAPRRER